MCVYTVDVYDSCSHRSGHIYQEIHVQFHSSANSGQEPDFLIRRAAKKVTFTADLRKNMRVCECVCILSMYMIHAVIVLGIFIRKFMYNFTALRIVARSQISLFAEQRKNDVYS